MCQLEMGVPTGDESLQLTIELEAGCADRRWMCRQETEMPTGLSNLEAGCADRRGMCRQDMRAFSVDMNCRLGVPTGEGYVDRR